MKYFPNLLPIPSDTYDQITNMNILSIKDFLPEINLFGESSGISTRSFADNFIQGLKHAEKINNI